MAVSIQIPTWTDPGEGSATWTGTGNTPLGWTPTADNTTTWTAVGSVIATPPAVISAITDENNANLITEDPGDLIIEMETGVPVLSTTPPLTLLILPATQTIPIAAAGPVSANLSYVAAGGSGNYTFATTANGLTAVGGDTASCTLSTTLILGQDTVFPISVTVNDGLTSVTQTASVEFKTLAASTPLNLAISPTNQAQSRTGPGSLGASVTYTPSGGTGLGYAYATAISPLGPTIVGGNTATPSISANLTDLQDTVFTLTGMLTDSSGASTTTTASIELKANPVPVGLSLAISPSSQKLSRQGPGTISTAAGAITYSATGGSGTGYSYSTSVSPAGATLDVTTPSAPVLSATLTNLQDTVFTLSVTVTDSLGATATNTTTVEFQATALPLTLTASPSSQLKTIAGPGTLTTQISYAATGGDGNYTFSTVGGGLTVSGAASVPTLSATLTQGQDIHYTVTGTVRDGIGTPAATTTAAVEFKSTVADAAMAFLACGINADDVGQNLMGSSLSNAPYTTTDMSVMKGLGVTYFRIPMDISFIMNGYPITGYPGQTSSDSTTGPALQHIEDVMALMIGQGFGVVPVLFIDQALRNTKGTDGTFDSMMTGAMTFMASRWMNPSSQFYRPPSQLILNIYNEPRYGPTQGFAYSLWSDPPAPYGTGDQTAGLMPKMVNAVRAAAPNSGHTLLIDTVGLAHPDVITNQGISPDPNVVYSMHIYQPSNLTGMGVPGFGLYQFYGQDKDYVYPGHGQDPIGSPAGTGEVIAAYQGPLTGPNGHAFQIAWQTGSKLTQKGQKQAYYPDVHGNPIDGTQLDANGNVIKARINDYWFSEWTQNNSPTLNLHDYIAAGKTWADNNGVRIIIGEFGASNACRLDQRKQWVADVIAYAKAMGIPRSYWSIVGNFFGIRPKGATAFSTANYDTNVNSQTYGYDLDLLALLPNA